MTVYAKYFVLNTEQLKYRVVIGGLFIVSYLIFNILTRSEKDKHFWTGYDSWNSVHSWLLDKCYLLSTKY
jgi:hypothetical protein